MTDKPKAQTMRGKAVVHVEEAKRLPQTLAGSTVSSDTLRPQDLIRAFRNTLHFGWPTKHEWLNVEYGITAETDLERWCNPVVGDPAASAGFLSTELEVERRHDDVGSLIADLLDALAEVAPAGCSFGAHPGDGACFGFWSFKDPEDLMDEARDMAREVEFDREGELPDEPDPGDDMERGEDYWHSAPEPPEEPPHGPF
jgi:hypothetical protein